MPAETSITSVVASLTASMADGSLTNELTAAVPALEAVGVSVLVEPSVSMEEPTSTPKSSSSSQEGAIIGGSIAAALVVMLVVIAAIMVRKQTRTTTRVKDHIGLDSSSASLAAENVYNMDSRI